MSEAAPGAATEDVLETAAGWRAGGRRVALATVINTWGSSPRPVGSQLAVGEDGAFVGSVSGGCIEGAVVEAGHAAMTEGTPRLLEFGVTDEMAWEVGLACGGTVQVYVEPLGRAADAGRDTLGRLLAAHAAKTPVALATELDSGRRALVFPDRAEGEYPVPDAVAEAARTALRRDRSTTVEADGHAVFVHVFNPPLRLVLVGAVHIAQALAPMAALSGYAVTVIDPRRAFATPERFPDIAVVTDWPDEALGNLAPDPRTAVVTLTHDPKLDDPALDVALRSEAFYIGALGSKRTQAKRIERLRERGFGERDVARIHGPAGLPLGGRAAAEIAVSILAQITEVRHRAGTG